MDVTFAALIPVVYVIIEVAEAFGVKRKYAHLCAIPLGILVAFVALRDLTVFQHIIYGIIIGIASVGSCDTVGNCRAVIKKRDEANAAL